MFTPRSLSSFFLWIIFTCGSSLLLLAQENIPATPPISAIGATPSPSDSVHGPSIPEKSDSSSNKETNSYKEENPSTAPSTENTPAPSGETSQETSSSMPTDPSMIPPPEDSSPTSENPALSNEQEGEAQTTPSLLPSVESIEKKKQELKVRYYQVRAEVEKEKDVAALKEKAAHATTDEGKRQALRAYYSLLFATMKKMDPTISERCDLLERAYLHRLEQVSVEPTVPLTPPPESKESSH